MKRSSWRYLWKSVDIRNKLLITLGLLIIYRFAANIPVPGINRAFLETLAGNTGAAGNLFNLLDLLSGGTVSRFSILAMGVYPYITAQIILQLLVPIIPALERRMRENPREAQKWQEKWTVILTIPMALLSAIGQINIFNSMGGGSILNNFGFQAETLLPTIAVLASMIAGTMFAIWIGQLISEYGIPNQGLSLIIFAGYRFSYSAELAVDLKRSTKWLVVVPADPGDSGADDLCDCVCAAGPPACAGAFPWPPCGQPHVNACAQQLAFDGEHGRDDPAHFLPSQS